MTGLDTLVCCWISVAERACLQFNLKDFPLSLVYSSEHKIITLTLWELIPMKITPFPAERVTRHCSFPGNLSKLLHLFLHTFTTSTIAIKLVVDFSTGFHTNRFEATISVKPFLVFLDMHLYGHMEPPPEMFGSVEQPSHSADDSLGACFLLDAL